MFKPAFPQIRIQDFWDIPQKIISFKEQELHWWGFFPYETLCKCHFGCSNLPNKATKRFLTQKEVTFVIDNWNMYEKDVIWKWPPDLSGELLAWGMAEVQNLCGNLTVSYTLADCTSRITGWWITQKDVRLKVGCDYFCKRSESWNHASTPTPVWNPLRAHFMDRRNIWQADVSV